MLFKHVYIALLVQLQIEQINNNKVEMRVKKTSKRIIPIDQ